MVTNTAEKIEIDRIAKEKNITSKEAIEVIDSMYDFIRKKIIAIDFRSKELSKEEFNKLKTNFNIPCIGKLCASYTVYKKINKIDKDDI